MDRRYKRKRKRVKRPARYGLECLEQRRMLCAEEVDFANSPLENPCELTNEAFVSGQLADEGDVDWFQFEGVSDTIYEIAAQFSHPFRSTTAPSFTIYESGDELTELASNNEGAETGVRFVAPTSGRYFLVVRETDLIEQPGNYDLFLRRRPSVEFAVETLPGDELLDFGAPNSSLPNTIRGELSADNLIQSFTLRVVPGDHVYLAHVALDSLADATLVLRDANGDLIATDDNRGHGVDSKLYYGSEVGGELSLEVSGVGTGTFDLSVSVVADEHADLVSESEIISDTPVLGMLETGADQDVFHFEIQEHTDYLFTANFLGGAQHRGRFELTTPAGQRISRSSFDQIYELDPGVYNFRVSTRASGHDYRYGIELTSLPDDHPDVIRDDVVALMLDQPATGTINHELDQDVFFFDALAGEGYEIKLLSASSPTRLNLLDSESIQLATFSSRGNGQEIMLWTAPEDGRYYVMTDRGLGDFEIDLSLVPDDYAHVLDPSASVLPFETETTFQIETKGDVDVVAFQSTAEYGYQLLLTPNVSVGIFSVDGTEIQTSSHYTGTHELYSWTATTTELLYVTLEFPDARTPTTITAVLTPVEDDHLDDASPEVAMLTVDQTVSGQIGAFDDLDVFQLVVDQTEWIEFAIPQWSFSNESAVLYSEAGERVATLDSPYWRPPGAGTYFLHFASNIPRSYELGIASRIADPHPDSISADAVLLSHGYTRLEANMANPIDRDVFAFDLELDDELFVAHTLDSETLVGISLFDSNGAIVSHGDFATPFWDTSQNGRYYLQLSSEGQGSGDYALDVQLGTDPPASIRDMNFPVLDRGRQNYGYQIVGDVDTYQAFAEAGESLFVQTNDIEPSSRRLVVYPPGSVQGTSSAGRLDWVAEETGHYLIKVTANNNPGIYHLEFGDSNARELNDDYPDVFNDFVPALLEGETVAGVLESTADADLFSFAVGDGEHVELQLTRESADWQIQFYSEEQRLLDSFRQSSVKWAPPTPGTFFVKLHDRSQLIGAYGLTYQTFPDDVTNQFEASLAVELGRTYFGFIEAERDRDVFSFAAEQGKRYALFANSNTTVETVFGSSDGPAESDFGLRMRVFEPSTSGTYFISFAEDKSIGRYGFAVYDLSASAEIVIPAIDLYESQTGQLQAISDVAAYSFMAEKDQKYQFNVENGIFLRWLDIFDQDGKTLLTDRQIRGSTWRAPATGQFFALLAAGTFESFEEEEFQFVVQPVPDDHFDEIRDDVFLIPGNSVVRGSFEALGDLDYFRVQLGPYDVAEIELDFPGFQSIPLYNAHGKLLDSSVDRWIAGDQSATYYFRVGTGSTLGDYELHFRLLFPELPDSITEANDRSLLPLGESLQINFEFPNDKDVIAVDAQVGDRFLAELSLADNTAWIPLTHHRPDGTMQTVSTSAGFYGWEAKTAGRHYLELSNPLNEVASYQWKLERIDDDFADDLSIDPPPMGLPLGIATTGRLDVPSDRDLIPLDIEANTSFKVAVTSEQNQSLLFAELLNANGEALTIDGSTQITWKSTEAARYYVSLQLLDTGLNTSFLPTEYTVQLESGETDDHPNVPQDAATYSIEQTIAGSINQLNDVDVFKFELNQGQRIAFDFETFGVDGVTQIWDPAGMPLQASSGLIVPETGVYAVGVLPQLETFDYELRLFESVDDLPDVVGDPLPELPEDRIIRGHIDITEDRDLFVIDAERWEYFAIRLRSQENKVTPVVRLLNVDGEEILGASTAWQVNVPGRYVMSVSAHEVGDYEFEIDRIADEFGNSPMFAEPIAFNTLVHGRIAYASDVDVVSFEANAGQLIKVDNQTAPRIHTRVVSASGAETPYGNQFYWRADVTGTHYIETTNETFSRGNYNLEISPVIDQPEAIDPASTENDLHTGVTGELSTTVDGVDDVDVFAFSVEQAGQVYHFTTQQEDPSAKLTYDIFNAAGQRIATIRDQQRWIPQFTGRYYLEVASNSPQFEFEYFVRGEKLSDDVPDRGTADSPKLVAGNSVSGFINFEGDKDVFAFTTQPGESYTFTAGADFRLTIHDEAGETLASYPEGGGVWAPNVAGHYFVSITSSNEQPYDLLWESQWVGHAFDLDDDEIVSASDLALLEAAIENGENASRYDLNQSGNVDHQDIDTFFEELNYSRADFNLDGQVDFTDFLTLSKSFGTSGKHTNGDATGDGEISFEDFLLLSANFK